MNAARSFALACLTLLAPLAFAQQPPPASPAPATAPPPQGNRHQPQQRHSERGDMREGHDEHGMGIVPPGTWWRNPNTITALSLSAEIADSYAEILPDS